MAMPWRLVFHMAEVVWMVLQGWLSSCLMVADEIARASAAATSAHSPSDNLAETGSPAACIPYEVSFLISLPPRISRRY
ncbi:unnamed protein product [Spirodela intermedia]|uniref:Uncharacterized protein n=1 Tax=Spirodela intermedia TaxID=51605 RepID=A0A7I8JHH7_SPIIN|nr:unnamed protein product [Spirodela intermedia]CAA6669003.1 unnamed protein product [Spirodela intermedia]